jgi:uncharacterized protein with HEPN domain
MSRLPLEYLQHIADEIEFLLEQKEITSESEFTQNPTLQRAFTRSLEIIGEASKQVGKQFQDDHPEIPWSSMAKFRDKLIHHYFGVDYDLVWNVVEVEIPKLRDQIRKFL